MANSNWGGRDFSWGAALLRWGQDDAITPTGPTPTDEDGDIVVPTGAEVVRQYAFEIHYRTGPRYFWTGQVDEVIRSRTYRALGDVVNVSQLGGKEGNSDSGVRLTLVIKDDVDRAIFLQDPGVVVVTIHLVFSVGGGRLSWQVFPRSFTGRISSTVITGNEYQVEIVDRTWDTTRTALEGYEWSHEQLSRDAAARGDVDRGFEHLVTLASGIETRWPT